MRAMRKLIAQLGNFAASRRDGRLCEEMEQHLAMQTEENIRAGLRGRGRWKASMEATWPRLRRTTQPMVHSIIGL